jgi:hypothetical protein
MSFLISYVFCEPHDKRCGYNSSGPTVLNVWTCTCFAKGRTISRSTSPFFVNDGVDEVNFTPTTAPGRTPLLH